MKITKLLTLSLSLCFLLVLFIACDFESNSTPLQTNNTNQAQQTEEESKKETESISEVDVIDTVNWLSQRQIWHQDDENRYVLVFCLGNYDEEQIAAPATVEIKIKNDSGEIVYSATKSVTTSDYSKWYYNNGAVEKYQATIYINDSEITYGDVDSGNIYFTVYNTGHFSFDESVLRVDQLPVKPTTIILPTLPDTIADFSYSGKTTSAVKISNITYEINDNDLYIYFSGEKTYDVEGNKYSRACVVGWKLYDSDGYIVDSGTFYSPNIAVGEKFRNEKAYAWDVIKPGETYTFVISNVD